MVPICRIDDDPSNLLCPGWWTRFDEDESGLTLVPIMDRAIILIRCFAVFLWVIVLVACYLSENVTIAVAFMGLIPLGLLIGFFELILGRFQAGGPFIVISPDGEVSLPRAELRCRAEDVVELQVVELWTAVDDGEVSRYHVFLVTRDGDAGELRCLPLVWNYVWWPATGVATRVGEYLDRPVRAHRGKPATRPK